MSRADSLRIRTRRRDGGFLSERPQPNTIEESSRLRDGEVHGVIGEWRHFDRYPKLLQQAMHTTCGTVNRMMDVDCEVQDTAWRQHARELPHNLSGIACVVDDIVRDDDVKGVIIKREPFAVSADRLYARLPVGKEICVFVGEWIDTHGRRNPEEKDDAVRATSHFQHSRVERQWTVLLDLRFHRGGMPHEIRFDAEIS